MARVVLLCVFLTLQMLHCRSQEQDPSVGEYFLEAVDLLNRTRWRYFLPEDTDIDLDGNLSDFEIQHKFNTYMGEVFKLIDDDKDNSITEEELRSLKLDIPHLTKAVDIALENFPLRPFFLAADGNGDGVYDENDFYIPEKNKNNYTYRKKEPRNNLGNPIEIIIHNDNKVTARLKVSHGDGVGIARIGQHEGTVICKSLGYDGLERVLEFGQYKYSRERSVVAYSCNGTEAVLEDCQKVDLGYRSKEKGMGVVCQDGAVHLVGGKDAASGDVMLGKKGLACHPSIEYKHKNSEVICRELGYSGLVRHTQMSAFTLGSFREYPMMNKEFFCNGTEKRLADCKAEMVQRSLNVKDTKYCFITLVSGVICETDGNSRINQGLSDLIEWNRLSAIIWEPFGRCLFIADANGDEKFTLEELASKGKQLLTKILEFLDQNQDGKISLEDLNLHLLIEPIQNLVSELFDDITAGQGEFDLYNIEIEGQDFSKSPHVAFWTRTDLFGYLRYLHQNRDEKLNAADFFWHVESKEKVFFLISMASQKIDKNQDGKIQREELRQIIDYMFNQIDKDKNGALTLEDLYSLMRENGLDCFQVGAFKSFTKVFLDTIDTQTRNVLGYIFHQFDLDGNGQISQTELEQMHVPCESSGRFRYRDYHSYNSSDNSGPNARKDCGDMLETFFGRKLYELGRSFPYFIFSEHYGWERDGPGRGLDSFGKGRPGRDEPRKETILEKVTSAACELFS